MLKQMDQALDQGQGFLLSIERESENIGKHGARTANCSKVIDENKNSQVSCQHCSQADREPDLH